MDETTYSGEVFMYPGRKFPLYGIVGVAIVLVAELLLFFSGIEFVGVYFTPIVWTGYILLVDALNLSVHRRSFIVNRRQEFIAMLPWSIICWLVFEAYNLYMHNWTYVGLPENLALRVFGYGWSFATIFPGILETADFIQPFVGTRNRLGRPLSRKLLIVWMGVGVVFLVLPLILPQEIAGKMFALVWLGFFLLLDPVNCLSNRRSIMHEMKNGNLATAVALILAGVTCGLLWEFWNYWATAKWHYTVPIAFVGPKLFEMPLLGFLGFIPFAFEVYAMQEFLFVLVPLLDRKRIK